MTMHFEVEFAYEPSGPARWFGEYDYDSATGQMINFFAHIGDSCPVPSDCNYTAPNATSPMHGISFLADTVESASSPNTLIYWSGLREWNALTGGAGFYRVNEVATTWSTSSSVLQGFPNVVTVNAVPELSAWLLLAMGLAMLWHRLGNQRH